MININKVKLDFDNAINKIISIAEVHKIIEQNKFIEINLNKVNIVNYELKNDRNNESIYCLTIQKSSDDKILYNLIDKTDNQKIVISTSEISNNCTNSINAIYAIISYFTYKDNFNNIVSLFQNAYKKGEKNEEKN